ncbi:MAG: hypothetical protein IAE84_06535 [Saprospiraceae bacterium]|nr:hypothetical protein [Saprospiraceae bacterium]
MSTIELRTQLHHLIDQLDDRFLKAVHSMVSVYQKEDSALDDDPVLGYETDGTPVTASVFIEQAQKALSEAKEGKGLSVEEFTIISEQWLEPTV